MKKKGLKKELKLTSVFAIATGTTLSAGFFLLPGIAAIEAGPALILAYVIAAIPMIPAMFSVLELATAMPKAGGVYYFLDRTLGPYFGTLGGIGTWLALMLKVAFALVGMGVYINLFFPELPILPISVGFAVLLGMVNLFGASKSSNLQVLLVIGLLLILAGFIFGGIPEINTSNFSGFFDAGSSSILSTAALVYISYVGITKVASLSEEVEDPEKNLPRGVILSLATTLLIYVLGTTVMVGVVPMEQLRGDITLVATAAYEIFGEPGRIIISVAALLAFISVANAGTLSASRYPLAMGRDHIFPKIFLKLAKSGTPLFSIVLTVVVIVLILFSFDVTKIAKLASAFQLLMFALICFAVIVMRESKIESYDPGYKSPLYPWLQILGIVGAFVLIGEMGLLPISFSLGLIVIGSLWYRYYARKRVFRTGAIFHIFERLGRRRYDGLDTELRGILKEKGLREGDPFDDIVMHSLVLDINHEEEFSNITKLVSEKLCKVIPLKSDEIYNLVMEGTKVGATPVTHGVALPHFRTSEITHPELVLVRSKDGINISIYDPISHKEEERQKVNAIFFLVSPEDNPSQHLRILAKIAGRVDDETFYQEWMSAVNEHDLKEALLHEDNFFTIRVHESKPSFREIVEKQIKNITFPEGCLVATIRRDGKTIIPKGSTLIKHKDKLTFIGDPKGLNELKKMFN